MVDSATRNQTASQFPAALLNWAGHQGGGVRRLFHANSGRPGEAVFETNLLRRLRKWSQDLAGEVADTPRIVLLVGGPGNGKTEAVEATICQLDVALGCEGALIKRLSQAYHPANGLVPRLITVEAGAEARPPRSLRLAIVQDASVSARGAESRSQAQSLVDELGAALGDNSAHAYLCCVNRGMLDDAMIHAVDAGSGQARDLLEVIARAVSLAPDAPRCWPLHEYPDVAIWPMDAESLIEKTEQGDVAPAAAIIQRAVDPAKWPEPGTCAAGPSCPFCNSRKALASPRVTEALMTTLRWFELGTGQRLAFRDLFSLVSYLLAGSAARMHGAAADPCGWAALLVEADRQALLGGRPRREASTALFWLVGAQYQHALFHRWDRSAAASLLKDIKDLGLQDTSHTAMGLHHFLQSRVPGYIPATIAPLLNDLVALLDPATASPDQKVSLWGGEVALSEFDARFSRSVREGLDLSIKTRVLSANERELIKRLADLDDLLATPRLRRKKPTSATRIQRMCRDFSSRLVRRSIGARHATVPDGVTLQAFQRVVEDADGSGHELREIAIRVEDLLNTGDNFEVSLTTTFGQPLPPARNRATLVVPARRVTPREVTNEGRPRPSMCFLDVQVGSLPQPVALTYDLFKAVADLDLGLSPASLPRSVLALLDTTRARMAGSIVRDPQVRDRPKIVLGETLAIERYRGRFVSASRGGRG